jgi:uncharacterized protein YjiK
MPRVTTIGAALLAAFAFSAARAGEPADDARPGSLHLDRYVLRRGPVEIRGVRDNASGVAWSPETRTLLVAVNSPPQLLDLSPDGRVLRVVVLRGFDDTEGVCHFGGMRFAIAEEARRVAAIVEIPRDARSIDRSSARKLLLDPETGGNTGLEGIACDVAGSILFGVKEKYPRKVYRCAVPEPGEQPRPTSPWDAERSSLGMKDLAGLHFDAATGHLLVLSDDSRCVVECTVEGTEVSRLSLAAGSAGLEREIPQPEGITMDPAGNMYIVSEPNLLYVFRPPAGEAAGGASGDE